MRVREQEDSILKKTQTVTESPHVEHTHLCNTENQFTAQPEHTAGRETWFITQHKEHHCM